MRYIKKYENYKDIKIGDKILIRNENDNYKQWMSNNYYLSYIKKTIGTIRKINHSYGGINYAVVDYVPKPPSDCLFMFTEHEEDGSYSTLIKLDYFDFLYGTLDEIKYKIELYKNTDKYNL
jgi:hypothetical protein